MAATIRDLRWYVKKAARGGVALAAPRAAETTAPAVRVLTYHRIGDAERDPFTVELSAFAAQMAWLASARRCVGLAELEAFLEGTATPPAGAVLVTFDDGCPSLHEHALPVLRQYAIPAVAFIPVGEIDSLPGERLTWRDLEAVSNAGVTIGSHAWTHESLGALAESAAREQLRRSRQVLEQKLGRAVTSFAYPYGTRADFNPMTARLLGEAGYSCGFTAQHGAVRAGADRFALPRIKVEGGESLRMFERLCDGGLDAWGWVDHHLWRLQARG